MDESGHDHRQTPYEVHGGFALHDEELWPFVRNVMMLEQESFGARLADYKSEIKGEKLLSKDRFSQLENDNRPAFEAMRRQQLCRALLQGGLEHRPPTRDQLTAYAQASLYMADGLFALLEQHSAVVFAAAVPCGVAKLPPGTDPTLLRKDQIFLFERFFYFLEHQKQMGLLVMDEVEKAADRKFVTRLHDYFTKTANGRGRLRWIVPTPFFVSSDMLLPVQVADLVVYAINWGYRHPLEMTAPARPEILQRYGARLNSLKWKGDGYDGTRTYRSFGIFCVRDLFTARK
jgi:hypothetical protein